MLRQTRTKRLGLLETGISLVVIEVALGITLKSKFADFCFSQSIVNKILASTVDRCGILADSL